MVQDKNETLGLKAPTSDEFAKTLGLVTWLSTLSKEHKDLPLHALQARVMAPLMLKQVRVFTKGKQPIAAISWAYVSTEVRNRLSSKLYTMDLKDWRSGTDIVVVDCIAPFGEAEVFIQRFLSEAKESQARLKN